MRLVGAFSPRMDEETSSKAKPKLTLGGWVSRLEMDEKLRTGLLAEFMEGFVEDVQKECEISRIQFEQQTGRSAPPDGCDREFVFNSKSKGWHYGFLGSKKDSNVWHLWSAYALEPLPENPEIYVVAARIDSPPFQLFCRRRNRGPLAKARLSTSQRISAVGSRTVYLDSSVDEVAAAVPPIPTVDPSAASALNTLKDKKPPRKRMGMSSGSDGGSGMSPELGLVEAAKQVKRLKHLMPSSSSGLDMMSRNQNTDSDRRFELLLDLVRRVQLPGANIQNPSSISAAARRTSHSALVLVPGQDAVEFGELVLKLAKHWKAMEMRGLAPSVAQAQQFALHTPADDLAPPFASFLLGQQEFAEQLVSLANRTELQPEPAQVQALRAADQMLWMMQRQVLAVQRIRNEMRIMSTPQNWVSPSPTSPMPANSSGYPHPLQQDMLPPSPLIGLSGIPMTPYLVNQFHRRRMGSNTSTGSDPSVMMTDIDLEWFSKSLDALHADGGGQSL